MTPFSVSLVIPVIRCKRTALNSQSQDSQLYCVNSGNSVLQEKPLWSASGLTTEGIILIHQQPTYYAVAFLRKIKLTDLQHFYINQTNVREHVGSEKKTFWEQKLWKLYFLLSKSTYLGPYCHRNAKQKMNWEKQLNVSERSQTPGLFISSFILEAGTVELECRL